MRLRWRADQRIDFWAKIDIFVIPLKRTAL